MTTLLALYRAEGGRGPGHLRTALCYGAPAARRGHAGPARRPCPARHRARSAVNGPRLRDTHGVRRPSRLDAGLGSDAMRAAGRNLREIAPGLATLLVLEDVPEMDAAASPTVDTVGTTVEERP